MFGSGEPSGTVVVCSPWTGWMVVPIDVSVGPYSLIRRPGPSSSSQSLASLAGSASPATSTTLARPAACSGLSWWLRRSRCPGVSLMKLYGPEAASACPRPVRSSRSDSRCTGWPAISGA